MFYTKRTMAAAAALLLSAGAALGQDVLHARVSHDTGGLLVQGRGDGDWANAPINSLVLPGDTIWVDQYGTAEVEMPGGAYLRLADGTKAELTALTPTASVRAWMGSFYVHRLNRASGDFVVTTPSATVEVNDDSSVRIDVDSAGATVVSVRFGYAKVRATQGTPVGAGAGTQVFVDPGMLPSEAVPFSLASEDAFDQWNRERIKLIVTGPAATPAEVRVSSNTLGVQDLGQYGEWVSIDSRPYWRPTVVADYVPYRYGSWTYVPSYGHVWVGHYGFSYVTSHYGRWAHNPSYGWVWSYDSVWSPAWVAGVRMGPYHVWTPVDYYNRPIYWGDSAYFSVGGLRFSYAACSYVPYDNLYYGPGYIGGLYGTNFTSIYAGQVNIWNVYNRPEPRYRVPYSSTSDLLVRDYAPNRSVRGPSVYGGSRSASERVRTLEAGSGRGSFSVPGTSDRRTVRTAVGPRSHEASVRTVSRIDNVSRDTLLRQSSERAATVRSARSDVDSNLSNTSRERALTTTPSRGGNSVRTPATGAPVTRGGDSVRTPATGTPTTRSAPSTSSRTTPVPTTRNAPSTSSRTTPVPTTRNAPSTSSRTTPVPTTRSAPSTSSRTTPVPTTRSAPSTSSRTTPVPTTRSAPQAVRTTPPSSSRTTVTRPSSGARPTTTRTTPSPSRSYSAPSRSSAPAISTPSPSRSYSTPSRSAAPTISTPSPSRSYSAPSRSAAPTISTPSPSRSYSTPSPSRSYSAPSRSSAPAISAPSPSRSYSAPSSSSRSFSAPSSSSRSYSAPSSSSRSFSAPSSSSRGYSAPSSSSRSFSAPSSSSRSSAGISNRGTRGGR